jgi:hypothetical protein
MKFSIVENVPKRASRRPAKAHRSPQRPIAIFARQFTANHPRPDQSTKVFQHANRTSAVNVHTVALLLARLHRETSSVLPRNKASQEESG